MGDAIEERKTGKSEKGQKKRAVKRTPAPKAGKKPTAKSAATKAKPKTSPRAKTVTKAETGRGAQGATRKPAGKAEAAPIARVSAEQREAMIAEAAYYRAEHRGFAGGDPASDWLSAEAEIDAWLSSRQAMKK